MHTPPAVGISILRMPEVTKRTGLSRSSLYAHMQRGEFPRPLNISQRSVGWLETDVIEWISTRPKSAPATANHRT